MLRSAKMLSLTAKFYRAYLMKREISIGFIAAMAAFILRAYASGYLVPLSITNLVNYLQRGDGLGLRRALFMMALAAAIYGATEWLYRPFWVSIVKGISEIKLRLVNGLRKSGDPSDVVGRVANDVDFVMWNVGGMYTTFVPNLLTAATAAVTVWELSPFIGALTVAAMPLSLAILEPYLAGVERARSVERKYYSDMIHRIETLLRGESPESEVLGSITKWQHGMVKQVHYDRVFWSLSLLYGYGLPALMAFVGVQQVRSGRLSIGGLTGMIYALYNVFPPLINAMWGLCILGQSMVPIMRILELSGKGGVAETKALAAK
ncbi:ABC transporter ATP-binding protein [Acidilobus saccharovorans]|uniref:ABC transporter ATP-binding protein n=1 Tax=Acidilobus saccharovorans TaxID=242703 RepID=UPI000A83CA1D|nr:ABC transporter ATP-binding protein [Acidilobus saccharovorans]